VRLQDPAERRPAEGLVGRLQQLARPAGLGLADARPQVLAQLERRAGEALGQGEPGLLDEGLEVVASTQALPELLAVERERTVLVPRHDDAHPLHRGGGRRARGIAGPPLGVLVAHLGPVRRPILHEARADALQRREGGGAVDLGGGLLVLQVQADGVEQGVAVGRQLVGVARVIAGDAAAPGGGVVEEIAPVQAVGRAGQGGEEFGRVVVVAPVQQQAAARHAPVEAPVQHLERPDEDDAERLGQGVERVERREPAGEFPEPQEVGGESEAVLGPQPGRSLFEAGRHASP